MQAVGGTIGFMKACRNLWLTAGSDWMVLDLVARLLAALIILQPSIVGVMIDQGIHLLAAAAANRVLK